MKTASEKEKVTSASKLTNEEIKKGFALRRKGNL
jgi:hypothetical protein